jgi:hypothetical protein
MNTRIEQTKQIEDLLSAKQTLKTMHKTSSKSISSLHNDRIIRLIREKKYPLHISNVRITIVRDRLCFFPKLKINTKKGKEKSQTACLKNILR